MVLDLIEELAARAFNATYSFINSSFGKRRRMAATMLAYYAYFWGCWHERAEEDLRQAVEDH